MAATPQKIIFFDGICSLCNRSIDFVMSRDGRHSYFVAPLQGTTASQHLGQVEREGLDSVVLWDQGQIFVKSDAVLRIVEGLPGYGWVKIFRLIPRWLRDVAYDAIANRRYQWFGKRNTCRLPTEEERRKFLP